MLLLVMCHPLRPHSNLVTQTKKHKTAAERIGVFAEPELEFRYLGANDSFLIIASDGVFEFISSQHVVDMVSRG
jgi:serine/threonine protein phosphatase PrpC